eukprot:18063-Heterococcus_DN1.PRE.2
MAQEAAKDVEALERILHRLVMTPDDKLAGVLAKLLPKLLEKLNNAEATLVRPKVIELLSHISKRARPNTSITLPCEELLSLCLEAQAGPMTRNFAMVYLEMGLPRASNEEQSQVAVGLMQGISLQARFSAQHSLRLHLLATVLNNLKLSQRESSNSSISSSNMLTTAVQPLQDADAADVMDWFLDVALYKGSSKREADSASALAAAQPGLSTARLARLELRGQLAPPLLLARKLHMVRALKCDLFKPAVTVAPALAAACDTHHEVVAKAEDLLRSISSADRQGHVASDSALATHLLSLLLGDATRAPVSAAVSVRCLNWLTAECPTGLANAAEVGARVASQCLLNVHPSAATDRTNAARMRAGSARLAAFLAARCSDTALHSVGEALLHAAVVTLQQNGDPPGDSPTTVDQQAVAAVAGTALVLEQQRSATLEASYEVIAALAVRAPALALRDVAMLRQLFADIGTRESELRVRVAAALGALREAYKAAAGAAGGSQQVPVLLCLTASTGSALLIGELWELLWVAARSKEHRARLCSIEWACDLFPFNNAVARHLCAALSDDGVTAVRAAARRGLQPPTTAATSATAAATATTENSDDAAMVVDSSSEITQTVSQQQQQQQQLLPAFADFVYCALQSQSRSGHGPITVSELRPAALAHTLEFALSTLQLDTTATAVATTTTVPPEPAALSVFVARLEAALAAVSSAVDPLQGHASTQQLHRSAALCLKQLLLQHAQFQWSQQLCTAYTDRGQWLQHWLAHESSTDIRDSFAEIVGCVALYMAPDSQAVPLLRGLTLRARAAVVPVGTSSAVQMGNRTIAAAHGAACAVGAALSNLATAAGVTWSALQSDVVPRAMSAVTALVGHPVTLLHTSACTAVGRIGAVTALPLPLATATTISAATDSTTATDTVMTLQAAFERLWSVCKVDGVIQDAGKRAESAVEAAGNACRGVALTTADSASLELSSQLRVTTLDKLFALASTQKKDELHFAVGCAAAVIAATGPLRITTATADTLAAAAAAHASKHVALPQTSTLQTGVSDKDHVTVDALEHVLKRVLLVLLEDHSPHIVNAGCVYLLCLVSELQGNVLLTSYLPAVQAAFLSRLTVKNELAQEVAGRGLALVYKAAGEGATREALVEALVAKLTTNR